MQRGFTFKENIEFCRYMKLNSMKDIAYPVAKLYDIQNSKVVPKNDSFLILSSDNREINVYKNKKEVVLCLLETTNYLLENNMIDVEYIDSVKRYIRQINTFIQKGSNKKEVKATNGLVEPKLKNGGFLVLKAYIEHVSMDIVKETNKVVVYLKDEGALNLLNQIHIKYTKKFCVDYGCNYVALIECTNRELMRLRNVFGNYYLSGHLEVSYNNYHNDMYWTSLVSVPSFRFTTGNNDVNFMLLGNAMNEVRFDTFVHNLKRTVKCIR